MDVFGVSTVEQGWAVQAEIESLVFLVAQAGLEQESAWRWAVAELQDQLLLVRIQPETTVDREKLFRRSEPPDVLHAQPFRQQKIHWWILGRRNNKSRFEILLMRAAC